MMEPMLYHPIFFGIFCVWCFIVALRYSGSNGQLLMNKQETALSGWGVALIVAIWIGLRPISGYYFADMRTYANFYQNLATPIFTFDWSEEWAWANLSSLCKMIGLGTDGYFTLVSLAYTLTSYYAMRILIPHKSIVSLLLLFTSLMFFAFATNGLRNGLACHLTMLAFTLWFSAKRVSAIVLAFLAYGIHHSVGIPIMAFGASLFLYKRPQWALSIWLLSIVASLLLGNTLTGFIEQFSIDDRLSKYNNQFVEEYGDQFSQLGFRWDFLLYSAMPILLGYYTIVKRRITDNWYSVLFSTYCLANAFWVIFIRAAFSNRFAYLSWFLYPVMVAYPLFMLKIWPDQDKKIGLILMAYAGFTAFMQFVYW